MFRFAATALCSLLACTTAANAQIAGFEAGKLADGTEIGVWYPAKGAAQDQRLGLYMHHVAAGAPMLSGRYPLVVISHGSGGDFAEHADTAQALAEAGFVVAALTHRGDNWRDRSGATNVAARPKALSALIDHMLGAWRGAGQIDGARVGAFGFSSGGFTVLAAAGGKPDLSRIAEHCTAHPTHYACQAVRARGDTPQQPWSDGYDARIKAIVVAAPALGFTYAGGLAKVRVPVQLWHASGDQIVPAPYYAHAVQAALPAAPEFHTIEGAGHFDFVAPCVDRQTAPQICTSAGSFDRAAFHHSLNSEIARFFARQLHD